MKLFKVVLYDTKKQIIKGTRFDQSEGVFTAASKKKAHAIIDVALTYGVPYDPPLAKVAEYTITEVATKRIQATLFLRLHLLDTRDGHLLQETYVQAEPTFTLYAVPVDLSQEQVFELITNEQIQERIEDEIYHQPLTHVSLQRQYPTLPPFTLQIAGFAYEKIYFKDVTHHMAIPSSQETQ